MVSAMRTFCKSIPLVLAIAGAGAASATGTHTSKTRTYIDHAWNTLTRSTADCASLTDRKVATRPVLYLPAGLPMPAAVRKAKKRCNVDVRVLPQRIRKLGSFQPQALSSQGLLYLPHPYVVPGGFFNEMYGWDSYFIELGLIADHRDALARGMVENFLFEVKHYGGVLNANRTYYLTRSQPPFLGEMIRDLLHDPRAFSDSATATAWLRHAYPLAVRDYSTWTRKAHRAGQTGLARYFGYGGHGPVLEARNAHYYRSVITWLLAHPSENHGYLVKAPRHPDPAQAAQLKHTSCNVDTSKVCANAWVDGHRLSATFYRGDRAMRESGFDTTFRFGPYSGSATHYAPVGLNSLLYRYARDLHDFARRLGGSDDARHWAHAAKARKKAINTYLWRPAQGMYTDYDFVTGTPSHYAFITTFYPLWAGLASKAQARAVRDQLDLFERKGGLQTSTHDSGAQWDAPFGWAPTNWLAVAGLEASGFHADARRVARKFTATVDRGFAHDHTIREKYNMATGNADVNIRAGYTQNVIGFGWTNAAYLKMEQVLQNKPD